MVHGRGRRRWLGKWKEKVARKVEGALARKARSTHFVPKLCDFLCLLHGRAGEGAGFFSFAGA